MAAKSISSLLVLATLLLTLNQNFQLTRSQAGGPRRPPGNPRNRICEKPSVLRDADHAENAFVVRIRTTFNETSTVTCNGVIMDERLVLSDRTCITGLKGLQATSDMVQVISGDVNNEQYHDVDAIYTNEVRDRNLGLALFKINKPVIVDSQCRQLSRPEKNYSLPRDAKVKVYGFNDYDFKYNKTQIAVQIDDKSPKHICAPAGEVNETPGSQLLKGAPMLYMVDCRNYQLVGILNRVDTIPSNGLGSKKHQDCYVAVSSQMKWFESVKIMTESLIAKKDGEVNHIPVISVSLEGED